jgi:hypothetical protein
MKSHLVFSGWIVKFTMRHLTSGEELRRADIKNIRGISKLSGILFLVFVVVLSSAIKIQTTLSDPNFPASDPIGSIRSDPGLIYYILERIIDNRGLPPEDFRADPRVTYPLPADLPSLDTVSQEFPIAWAYMLFGKEIPLHVFCLYFMSVFSCLSAIGVYFLTKELTSKVQWACFSVILFAITDANYRTMGFLLMREDFSLPFYAIHLALLARVARTKSIGSMVACAISLVVALASWHAMSFIVTLEVFTIFIWFLRTGNNPFHVPKVWLIPTIVLLFSLGIPVLQRTNFLFSIPFRMVAGVLAAYFLQMRGFSRSNCSLVAVGVVLAISGVQVVLASNGSADYAHVWSLMFEKIRHLGILPSDPNALSPDVRLMWQGPFSTLHLDQWNYFFGITLWLSLPFLVMECFGWVSGKGNNLTCLLAGFTIIALANSWLVERVMVLPGLLLPVCTAIFLSRVQRKQIITGTACVAIAWQGVHFGRHVHGSINPWYQFVDHAAEYRALIQAIPSLVPDNAAILADSVSSTAILAHTRHPIVLQPKWEEKDARERVKEFLQAVFHGTPSDLRRLALSYDCRYILIDRWILVSAFRYLGGAPIEQQAPTPGTAAERFLGRTSMDSDPIPGYRLIYRSPTSLVDEAGCPTDQMRIYEISALPGETIKAKYEIP